MLFNDLIDKVSPFVALEKYYPYAIPETGKQTKNKKGEDIERLGEKHEYIMYDFYVLDYLKYLVDHGNPKQMRDLSPELVDSVNDAVEKLFPWLREELLRAVFYAICAEMRNTTQRDNTQHFPQGSKERKLYNSWLKYMKIHRGSSNDGYSANDLEILGIDKPRSGRKIPDLEKQNTADRNLSYKAAHYAMKENGASKQDFVNIATDLFFNGKWPGSYGGPPWGRIGEGWTMLKNAEHLVPRSNSSKAMSVAIDHVYDLQHNTDTVFNKLNEYYNPKNGYGWIKDALNHKADVESYYDLIKHSTGAVKSMAIPVLYNRLGTTWQEDIYDTTPKAIKGQKNRPVSNKNAGNNQGNEFEVGDYIEYTGKAVGTKAGNAPGKQGMREGLTPGKVYKVVEVNGNLIITVENDAGNPEKYFEYQFKKVPAPSIPTPPTSQQSQLPDTQPRDDSGWKKGDTVLCVIDSAGGNLTSGEHYKLLSDATKVGGAYFVTINAPGVDPGAKFSTTRFKFVKAADPSKNNYKDWKVGDMLKCVDNSASPLTVGKLYKCTNIEHTDHDSWVTIENDNGDTIGEFVAERFVNESKPDNKPISLEDAFNAATGNDEELNKTNVKVGDEVICIDDAPAGLTKGKTYTVTNTYHNTMEVKDDFGNLVDYYYTRFKKLPKDNQASTEVPATPQNVNIGDMLTALEDIETFYASITKGKKYKVINKSKESLTILDNDGTENAFSYEKFAKDTSNSSQDEELSQNNLNPGDLIEAIDSISGVLTAGKVYEVKDTYGETVEIIDDSGQAHTYYYSRFKKTDKPLEDSKSKKIDPYNVKVGDKIQCVDTTHVSGLLTPGKIYEVIGVHSQTVEVVNDNGGNSKFYYDRFQKAPTTKTTTQNDFKVGDTVVCIDASFALLTAGKKYEVLGVNGANVDVVNDNGIKTSFYYERFEKAPSNAVDAIDVNKIYTQEEVKKLPDVNNFNVDKGDEVVCVSPGSQQLTFGKVYEVLEVQATLFKIVNDMGSEIGYSKGRFKKAPNNVKVKQNPKPGTFKSLKEMETTYGFKVGDKVKHKISGTIGEVLKFYTHHNGEDGIEVKVDNDRKSTANWKAVNAEKYVPYSETSNDTPEPETTHKPQYKSGDYIKCIDNAEAENLLTNGKNYTVVSSSMSDGDEFIRVKNDKGSYDEFHISRFEPLKAFSKYKVGDKIIYDNPPQKHTGTVKNIKANEDGTIVNVFFDDFNDDLDIKEDDDHMTKVVRPFKDKFAHEKDHKVETKHDVVKLRDIFSPSVGDHVKVKSTISNMVFYGVLTDIDKKNKEGLVEFHPQHGTFSRDEWFPLKQIEIDDQI